MALGWHSIPATVVAVDALRNELAERDENRVRRQLTALQEEDALARELQDYEIKADQDANEKYGAFKVVTHDDLVTALGLAVQQQPGQPFRASVGMSPKRATLNRGIEAMNRYNGGVVGRGFRPLG